MHVLEVVERGARRRDDIAAAVIPPVLFEAEALAGARHELPQTVGAHPRLRVGLECALDHRQERELERHPARFDLFDDVMQVGHCPAKHAFQICGIVREPGDLLVDLPRIDIFEFEAGANAVEDVRILLRRESGDVVSRIFDHAGGGGFRGDGRSHGNRRNLGSHERCRPRVL